MSLINNEIKIYENTYITKDINVQGNCNIKNDLFTNNLSIRKKLRVDNLIYIDSNLNINKDLKTTNIYKNSLLDVKENIYVENNINMENSIECMNIYTKNLYLELNNRKRNYLFNNNVIIYNTTNIEKDCILNKNLYLYDDLFSYDLNSITSNLNIINTKNALIKKNVNSEYSVSVNNNIKIDGYLNLFCNINIKNNVNITKDIIFKENSSFIMGNNNFNYNKSYSLRYNDIRGTLETYLNKEWRAISHLYTRDYKTSILFKENDEEDAYNIIISQNMNKSLLCDYIKNTMYIYKNVVNIYNNLNIKNSLYGNNNLLINNDLNCNNDLFVKGLLELGINKDEISELGSIRYNEDKELIELYKNNKWSYIKMENKDNGIEIDNDDNIILYTDEDKERGFIINNNICLFKNNINIKENLTLTSGIYVKNNLNIKNKIYFDNIAILKNNIDLISAYISPNYNNRNIENYKYLNINDEIKDKYIKDYYESDNYYCNLYKNKSNNITSSIISYDNELIINNNIKFEYHIFEIYDVIINKLEIYVFKNNNNYELIELSENNNYYNNIFDIKVYDIENNIIFNNKLNNKEFRLKGGEIYKIKIKKENNIDKLLLIIKLKGLYVNNLLFENKLLGFLYKIDNRFNAECDFLKDIELKKKTNIKEYINVNNFNIEKLYINENKNNNSILKINNDIKENILSIKNNTIIIGNVNINLLNLNKKEILIKTPLNYESLYIEGDVEIKRNMNINNDINIKNNCIINDLIYNDLKCKENIIINNDINLNDKLIIENINVKNINIIENNNILQLYKNNIKNIEYLNLNKNNIIINNNNINLNNKLIINYDKNININSKESFNLFSIGNKINPNLSINKEGDIEMYSNKLYINNIDILYELNKIINNIN